MTEIRVAGTDELSPGELAAIRAMLVRAFDGDFPDTDWAHTLGGWHVVAIADDGPKSHAAVVPRRLQVGGRTVAAGYVEGVATDPAEQRRGLGTEVMATATDVVRDRFEMGALSTDRTRFYERLGWERWHGPTFVRHGQRLVRTAEEDAGIMVLRHGPSADVSLTEALVCEARSGDAW